MSARDALEAIGRLPDDEIDLAGAALQLARIDAPEGNWQAARATLSSLARDAVEMSRDIGGDDLSAQAGALVSLVAGRWRFSGDAETYDDPANANLIRVLERRRGLPVALGIVWLHCAHAAGWSAYGLDFPGHFLIGLTAPGPSRNGRRSGRQAVLDVFAGGEPQDAHDLRLLLKKVEGRHAELRPGLLRPMPSRMVLVRLQNNLKVRRLGAGDMAGGLSCLEDTLRIAPDEALLWREAALLNQSEGRVAGALDCYARFLTLVPKGDAADRARSAVEELRSRLN